LPSSPMPRNQASVMNVGQLGTLNVEVGRGGGSMTESGILSASACVRPLVFPVPPAPCVEPSLGGVDATVRPLGLPTFFFCPGSQKIPREAHLTQVKSSGLSRMHFFLYFLQASQEIRRCEG
jgi:hypothetical protein